MIVMSERVLTIEVVFLGIEQPKMAESVKVIVFNLEGMFKNADLRCFPCFQSPFIKLKTI